MEDALWQQNGDQLYQTTFYLMQGTITWVNTNTLMWELMGTVTWVKHYRIYRGTRNTSRQISFEFLFIKTRPPDKLHTGFRREIE